MNLLQFYTTTLFQVIFSRMLKQQIPLENRDNVSLWSKVYICLLSHIIKIIIIFKPREDKMELYEMLN